MRMSLIQAVWRRAQQKCEYCRLPSALISPAYFHIEHVRSRQHRGRSTLENLALACVHCNLHKGPNLSGVDPVSGLLTRLFNPRKDVWADHFKWRGPELVGLTVMGRATIEVLGINQPDFVTTREDYWNQGLFPP